MDNQKYTLKISANMDVIKLSFTVSASLKPPNFSFPSMSDRGHLEVSGSMLLEMVTWVWIVNQTE